MQGEAAYFSTKTPEWNLTNKTNAVEGKVLSRQDLCEPSKLDLGSNAVVSSALDNNMTQAVLCNSKDTYLQTVFSSLLQHKPSWADCDVCTVESQLVQSWKTITAWRRVGNNNYRYVRSLEWVTNKSSPAAGVCQSRELSVQIQAHCLQLS